MDLKRFGDEISIVIAKGCSEIVYKKEEKVKKSISILRSILRSYIESVISIICSQLVFK